MTYKRIVKKIFRATTAILFVSCSGTNSNIDANFHPGVPGSDGSSSTTPLPGILASNYVATSEGTISAVATDLATVDQVTFTLTASTTVAIEYWFAVKR